MAFIAEKYIDAAAESIGVATEEGQVKLIKDLEEKQPIITAYLFSEGLSLLTDEERNMLLYMILVIRKAYLKTHDGKDPEPVSEEELGTAEEKNWTAFNESSAKTFRERLDIFFENTPQEDLLAFIEDVLMDEEEEWVTQAGRDYIFITAKTVVDVWCRKG